ncbi:MAG TPA: heme lyase CcmF/NrfE family subunit, partial [Casimicrobium huifangae]|nr:heme lyase CcmF/NrfE family subunit [Casimicrobium huifangae]
MIPELGHFALVLAFFVCLTSAGVAGFANLRRGVALVAFARNATLLLFALVLFAFLCLMQSFAAGDFSVLNVATNSNSLLPLQYRISATWGSHEGSMLLWVLMLTGWSAAVAQFSKQLPDVMVARVLVVLAAITAVFLAFTLLTSNPFERLIPAAPEGRDLNPLLQDPGMIFHPPLLYMGYVGMAVVFAFAIAALWGGRLDSTWARWSRPWTIAAWIFLTCGIALGSFWAYYELGWGGWWFWDPVENASFMPWLVGTALIHSLAVTEKRGAFKAWTVLLAIAAFSLSLLGTFLVRSGVLTSVHAFATDPKRGVFILAFLVAIIGGSLLPFGALGHQEGRQPPFRPCLAEGFGEALEHRLLPGDVPGVEQRGQHRRIALGIDQAIGAGPRGVADLQPQVPQQVQHELDRLLAARAHARIGQEQQVDVGEWREHAAAVAPGRDQRPGLLAGRGRQGGIGIGADADHHRIGQGG